MKKYFKTIFVLILLLLFLVPGKIIGQENTTSAVKKYAITFPIAELGNCSDVATCKAYCDQEANKQVCISFAKAKGFYKENIEQAKAVVYAKKELGCTDGDSCKNFCEKKENSEKCMAFAQKYGFKKPQGANDKQQELVNKAKTVLGCGSPESCKEVCDKEENRSKCESLAREAGINVGNERPRVGPGGCNSEETCRSYCSEAAHKEECEKHMSIRRREDRPSSMSGMKGPGGCSSEQECRKYCDEHPNDCGQKINNTQRDNKEFKGDGNIPEELIRREMEQTDQNKKTDFPETINKGPEMFKRIPPPQNSNTIPPQNRDFRQERNMEQRPPDMQEKSMPPPNPNNFQPPNNEFKQMEQGTRPQPEANMPEVKGVSTLKAPFQSIFDFFFGKFKK